MPEQKTPQRLGIERMIEAGDLPVSPGPSDVPAPSNPRRHIMVGEGPCGNAGAWCSEGPVTTLLGWRRKLCDSCFRMWRTVVLGI